MKMIKLLTTLTEKWINTVSKTHIAKYLIVQETQSTHIFPVKHQQKETEHKETPDNHCCTVIDPITRLAA